MPNCPMCTKPLRELTRKCPTCQADLDLLVDYASFLTGGLQRADNLTKAGELGQAVWAYLEVLDVDPDNAVARQKVTQIVRAVRHFDSTTPTRRMGEPSSNGTPDKKVLSPLMVRSLLFGLLISLIFAIGFTLGFILAGGGGSSGSDNGGEHKAPPALGG